MMKLERRVERLERHVATAEELLAEVRARVGLSIAIRPPESARIAELEEELEEWRNDGRQSERTKRIERELQAELAAAKGEHFHCLNCDRLREQLAAVTAERDHFKARMESWKHEATQWEKLLRFTESERDALQARIDAGVRVCLLPSLHKTWSENVANFPYRQATALLIDRQPIAQDERKGVADRRVSYWNHTGHYRRQFQSDCEDGVQISRIEMQRSNNRRRTPGTMADRGESK
jgi:hypothetical protein